MLDSPKPPDPVLEHAAQSVAYVKRALGQELDYSSETLPLLDHYLRSVPLSHDESLRLVAATAGAYFGELIRRALGGRWDTAGGDALTWRLVLPTGISFAPAGMVAAAIQRSDHDDIPDQFDLVGAVRPIIEPALERMGAVTEDDYFSLCGRFDTLEHLHSIVLAAAAARQPATDDGADAADDELN